ncbi:MAG: aminoglycoside phosphotransferase family protein [Phormidesmis sp.]
MSELHNIATRFVALGTISAIEPLGNGNINSTFLVTIESTAEGAALPAKRFVMQQINTEVFKQPALVMQNMAVLSEHLQNALQDLPRRWEMPRILPAALPTGEASPFWVDDAGGYWRAITFIEDSQVFESVENAARAKEVCYGLAMFHRLISTLPVERLAYTLKGFHITPQYLAHYNKVLESWCAGANHQSDGHQSDDHQAEDPTQGDLSARLEEIQHCREFIASRYNWAHVLENAKAAGHLQLRPVHGDPKVNNIMLGRNGQAVSLIDLDTLQPGLVHYDIGDCLRSGCNLLGEETTAWRQVDFDLELAQAMLEGYLSLAGDFLTEYDYRYLYDGIWLIAFELGLRFFTDYLAGNVYFKAKHPMHNLDRALVQFQLASSIEAQAAALKAVIKSLR